MIRAVVFDCFGVFYVDPVFAYMRDPATPPEKATALHDLDKQAAYGLISKHEFVDQAANLLDISPTAAEARFFHGMHRNQPLLELAQTLRKTYKISLLSNIGEDMMDGFFSANERQQLFDDVILSGQVKLAKPDPAIFKLACQRLSVAPDEAIMIDDIKTNADAAISIGMHGICYQNFTQCKHELDNILGTTSGE